MPVHRGAILTDTNTVIEAHRIGAWRALSSRYRCVTVAKCLLAAELRGTSVAVNAVSPGYVRTDLTGQTGYMSPEEGARLPVAYALLGEGAETGLFVEPGDQTPW